MGVEEYWELKEDQSYRGTRIADFQYELYGMYVIEENDILRAIFEFFDSNPRKLLTAKEFFLWWHDLTEDEVEAISDEFAEKLKEED